MNFKKTVCVLLALVLVVCISICAFPVFAGTASNDSEENPAWLSDIYVRETSTDFVKNPMYPRSEGVYSRTLGGFRKEVNELKKIATMSSEDLEESYLKIITELYKLLDETGVFDEYDVMKNYLQTEHKIVFPADDSTVNKTYVAVVYACLKYDLLYVVMDTHFTIPEGTSINRAVVLLLSALLSESVPNDVETVEEYVIYNIKKVLIENGYQVSENADSEEIYTLYKIMMAEKQGYKIANHDVVNYTQKDKDYLTGAYTASIIKMTYDISPTPEEALLVITSNDKDAMPALILGLMIESKGESTIDDSSLEDLFKHACRLGLFDIDDEFYSDIYEYDVYLNYNCKTIWITPFALATEFGNDKTQYAKITINGTSVQSARSHKFTLTGDLTVAEIAVKYDDGSVKNSATYTLYIHNGKEPLPEDPTLPIPPFVDDSEISNGSSNSSGSSSNGNSYNEYIFKKPGDLDFVPYELGNNSSIPGLSSGKNPALSGSIDNASSIKNNTSSAEDGLNVKVIILYSVCAVVLIGAGAASLIIIKKKKGYLIKK